MAKEVIVTADKVKNRKKAAKIIKRSLLLLLVFLIVLYVILDVIYSEGRFTVTLDSNKTLESGLAIFDSTNNSHGKRKLEAEPIKFMDNISHKSIPADVNKQAEGSHNGKNYIAYTFFVENQGSEVLDYTYEVVVDDVIKHVDEAIRIRIYRNDEYTTYAKLSSLGQKPEHIGDARSELTTPFADIKESPDTIIFEKVEGLKPDDMDRITVVVWLEGDDPDCNDPLIGGELKMHMVITEIHIEQSKE